MIKTEAWVLRPRRGHKDDSEPLRLEEFEFTEPAPEEVLVEPLVGCWEGNMSHAITRTPVDICVERREERVVIGNAGVVRILECGRAVTCVRPGDYCIVFCNGVSDEYGFPRKIFGYDAPGTIGLLAKRSKLHEAQLIRIPSGSKYSLEQWAAFSLRYITAWANWKLAHGCWLAYRIKQQAAGPVIMAWGGGVAYAEVTLAAKYGFQPGLISSEPHRLELIRNSGITPIDRRSFPDLSFDDRRYKTEPAFRDTYLRSEREFLNTVGALTDGRGVAVFVDFIGEPVHRATVKALARPGILTTAGWKCGMSLNHIRALECMNWHVHVHTHYARYDEGREAVEFAEANDWAPNIDAATCAWDEIPALARAHAAGKVSSYFPLFEVTTRPGNLASH